MKLLVLTLTLEIFVCIYSASAINGDQDKRLVQQKRASPAGSLKYDDVNANYNNEKTRTSNNVLHRKTRKAKDKTKWDLSLGGGGGGGGSSARGGRGGDVVLNGNALALYVREVSKLERQRKNLQERDERRAEAERKKQERIEANRHKAAAAKTERERVKNERIEKRQANKARAERLRADRIRANRERAEKAKAERELRKISKL